MDLAYWIFPLGVVFAVCKILFDCGRLFQGASANLRKLNNAKVEKRETATPAAQADQAKAEIPSDPATQALNADPHVVIPFRGPAPKGDLMPMTATSNDTDPVTEEDVALATAGNEIEVPAAMAAQVEIDRKWAFYDQPTALRRNPDWKPPFMEPAEPVQAEAQDVVDEQDSAAANDLWDDYATMMRTDDGDLVPFFDSSMKQSELSLTQH